MKAFIPLAFALGAFAGCQDAVKIDGTMHAMCLDEDTGMEFEYIDLNNWLQHEMKVPEHLLADTIYENYVAGRGNLTELSGLETRDLTAFWNVCANYVSGVCANDHVIAWTGSLSSFSSAVIQMIASINHTNRLSDSPRSICTNYAGKGNICISWAAYYASRMTQQQIDDIANECAQKCEQQNNSCEARVVTDNTVEYFCVSSRSTNCAANGQIRTC